VVAATRVRPIDHHRQSVLAQDLDRVEIAVTETVAVWHVGKPTEQDLAARLVVIRTKPSIVAQASPIPSVPERQASHYSLALLCSAESGLPA
jgi:hypothetical protein